MRKDIRFVFFDWGDTLMVDYPMYKGSMLYWPRTTLMDGVAMLLPKIAERYRCVLLSNTEDSTAEQIRRLFTKHGIDQYISLYLTSKELQSKKPSTYFFINALRITGADAGEVLMVGNDYENDIVPAKDAGIKTVLITAKPGSYPKADYIYIDFSELSYFV